MCHNAGELADWDNSLFAKELAELQQLDSQKANVGTTARLRWAAGTLTTPSRRSQAGRLNRGSARASASEVTRQEPAVNRYFPVCCQGAAPKSRPGLRRFFLGLPRRLPGARAYLAIRSRFTEVAAPTIR